MIAVPFADRLRAGALERVFHRLRLADDKVPAHQRARRHADSQDRHEHERVEVESQVRGGQFILADLTDQDDEYAKRPDLDQVLQAVGRADQVRSAGQFLTADIAGEPIVVVRGDEKETIRVKLQPAATVKGRLLDAAGNPVKKAMLAMIEIPPAGPGQPRSLDTGVLVTLRISAGVKGANGAMDFVRRETSPMPITDDEGRFSITGLVPGLKFNLVWCGNIGGVVAKENDIKALVFRDNGLGFRAILRVA